MVKFIGCDVAGEVPPPYMPPGVPGLVTVTGAVPAAEIALCGIMATTWPEFVHVVVILVPLKVTNAAEAKLAPVTVRLKAAPPAVALLGES
jgi:hypothetical protein